MKIPIRNRRGLSPIFAVLILIAITVIAAVIVYMFTSGYLATMMGGGTVGQEKVAVESVTITAGTPGTALVYAKSVGGGPVTITEAIVKDSAGLAQAPDNVADVDLLADGTMNTITLSGSDFVSGTTYTITLISKGGNQFVSASYKAP